MAILFLNILTLLAPTQSADNLFHSFTVLCENENVLISSLHCFFPNVTPCPLVLLYSLTVKKIFLSIFSYPTDVTCERSVAGVIARLLLRLSRHACANCPMVETLETFLTIGDDDNEKSAEYYLYAHGTIQSQS